MPESTRRGFLGTIAAAFAAPAASKFDEAVGNDPAPIGLDMDWDPVHARKGEGPNWVKVRRFLLKNGLPDWRRQEIEKDAARYWNSNNLRADPDIEALRSVSATHKRRMNIKKEVDRQCSVELASTLLQSLGETSPRSRFHKKFGIYL